MEDKLSKETVDLVFNKLAKLLNNLFPGIVIIELFFHKGFFSTPPTTLYEFILFIIWAIILSIPYNFVNPFSIENFPENFLKNIIKKYPKIPIDKKELYEHKKDELENLKELLALGFITLKLLITYIALKFISYKLVIISVMGIPLIIMKLFTSIIITLVLSYPIGYLYTVVLHKLCMKYVEYRIK